MWDIFISHAHADLAIVRPFVELLKKDGYTVWFEPEKMAGGRPVMGQLADAVGKSAHLIAFLSDAYLESKWCVAELRTSVYLDPNGEHARTIPVRIQSISLELPLEIRTLTICDLTGRANFEQVYDQITRPIRRGGPMEQHQLDREGVEQICDIAFNAVDDPYVALFQVRRANEALTKYLYGREIGVLPAGATLSQLVEKLVVSGKLPQDINAALTMVQTYGNFAVRDQLDAFKATRESVAPALGALRLLTDWTFDRKPVDPWPEILGTLPLGDDDAERQIPGTSYFLRLPKQSQNSLGPLYSGRDANRNERVSINLVALPEASEDGFFEDLARFMRLRDSSIVSPLKFGRVVVAGKRRCLYLIMPWIDGVSAQDLTKHFGTLPPRAAYELCLGIAAALRGFHQNNPPLVHGDLKPANVLVDSFGTVRVLCVGKELATTSAEGSADGRNDSFLFSNPEQLAGAELTPKIDLFALYSVLFYVLSGNYPSRNTAALWQPAPDGIVPADPLKQLAHCDTAAEAQRVLIEACRGLPESTGLQATNQRYRTENDLFVPTETIIPVSGREFGLVSLCPIEGRTAWPLGERRVLVWETNTDTLAIVEGSDLIWRDSRPVRVRRVTADTRGRLAVGGWDGAIRFFQYGELATAVTLDGTIGDLRFTPDGLVAGSWKRALWRIMDGGRYEELLGPDRGVHRIAVIDNRNRFAVADLAGGLSVYSEYRKVLDKPPLGVVGDIAYAGARLVILTDEAITSMGLDGAVGIHDSKPGAVRLLHASRPGCCLLLVQPRGSREFGLEAWQIDENDVQERLFTVPANHELASSSQAGNRCTLSIPDGGFAYWRDGVERWAWTDALSATVSPDGQLIAVCRPEKVELYEDP